MRLYEMVNTPTLARARQMGFDTSTIYYHGAPDARPIHDVGFGDPHAEQRSSPKPFFFSSDKRVADSYADDRRAWDYQGAEAETVPVFLKMRNPKRLEWGGRTFMGRGSDGEGFSLHDEIDQARSEGHDSVIVSNIDDTYHALGEPKGRPGNVTAVFSSEQILIASGVT
jgi:hypothetical protein